TQSGDCKIRNVPFRTIRREQSHAIARLNSKFSKRLRQARDAPQHFLRRNGLPSLPSPVHLRLGIGFVVYCVEEKFVQRGIFHRPSATLTHRTMTAQRARRSALFSVLGNSHRLRKSGVQEFLKPWLLFVGCDSSCCAAP